ncbi:HNH endonuclease signature motif containing protein [Halomonas sp. 5021]|uniref:HNH endonuclease signature motif containing protein n=1 Tax=Halomonas sp. 5021 TaxID=3082156 RepID=UPI002FC7BE01
MIEKQKLLQRLLSYDPATGIFFWRTRSGELFRSERACNAWNARFANKEAGHTWERKDGYRYRIIQFDGSLRRAHRLAWLYIYGKWPEGEIDHIDRDGTNNRIENLRVVDSSGNSSNLSKYRNNTSGFTGVHLHKPSGTWHAYIKERGKKAHLGSFSTMEDALAARREAEIRLGYSAGHGKPRPF